MAISQMVGASIKRREDPRLVTGSGRYVDDISQTAVAHMHVVRSTEAHARILSIDTTRAKEADGVVAVFTGKDLKPDFGAPLPVTVCFVPDKKYPEHYPIAVDKVYYVGEPVAIVVASSRAAAEDAGERIDIRYESLPPVTDIEKAIEKDAPVLHEGLDSNLSYDTKFSAGDMEAALKEADVRIKQRLIQQRLIPIAVETRGVLADYRRFENKLTVYSSTQIPHFVKVWEAVILGVPESNVRVVAPEVGGGFGSKIRVYPEEILTALASKKLGRPVKWIEDRNENVKATHHGRSQIWDVEIAAKKDGTVLGIRPTQWLDLGAYCSQFGTFQVLGMLVAQGAYKMKAFDGRAVGIFTNRTPTDAYRGAGRPEATYLIERVMDLVARETGVDPVEVRRKNFVRAEDQPFTTLLGLTYDSGDYNVTLNKALEMVDYKGFRREQEEKAKKIAAHLLEAAEGDIVYENGKAFVKGTPSKAVTIQEIAVAAFQTNRIPKGMEGGLEATTFFDPSNFVWPFGAHIAVVEVDPETGATKILRYVAVDDVGNRINPMVVDGQLHGGIAQGIGQALFEEAVYDEAGQLRTGSLVDYLVPTAADLPTFELAATVTPSPVNPLGTKGIGEAGTIASTPAVMNAIVDALEPFGVKDVAMPATPQKLPHPMHRKGCPNR